AGLLVHDPRDGRGDDVHDEHQRDEWGDREAEEGKDRGVHGRAAMAHARVERGPDEDAEKHRKEVDARHYRPSDPIIPKYQWRIAHATLGTRQSGSARPPRCSASPPTHCGDGARTESCGPDGRDAVSASSRSPTSCGSHARSARRLVRRSCSLRETASRGSSLVSRRTEWPRSSRSAPDPIGSSPSLPPQRLTI